MDNLVHDLIAIANDLRRHIDASLARAGYGHRRPGFAPLLALVWRGPVPQVRLAEALGVSPQAASQTVGLAARAGLVARVPNPDDGRSKLVMLTDLGRGFVADGAAAITERADAYASIVHPRRFTRLDRALRRLCAGTGLADADAPEAELAPRTSIMAVTTLADDAMRTLHEAMERAGHGAITAGQNLVLVYIGPDGARSSELARAQRVSRQAVSAVLNDLGALGYVQRRSDATDGRGVVFVPTAKGRRVLADYVAAIDAIETRYAAILGVDRFEEMTRTARDLARMVVLEQAFAGAGAAPSVAPLPSERRQGELVDLGSEILRWLGDADAWWLSGFLREQVVTRLEAPDAGMTGDARAREGGRNG